MKFLLPHRFKKIGLYLSPIGLALWIAMQRGYVTKFCTLLFGHDLHDSKYVEYHFQNVSAAVIGFFSFLKP